MQLTGKVAVVTGASRGLGAALALRFADEGAELAICARSAAALERVAAGVGERGRSCLASALDVRDFAAVRSFVERTLERFGRVDALVVNAALLGPRRPLASYPVDAWDEVIDVNVNGAFHAVRAFLPALQRAGGGSILLVSSGVGSRARPNWGAYGVSKFAVEGLGHALAAELEGTGVRSNIVNPGRIRTAMRAAAYPDEDPGSLPAPSDVADVFVFLASDAARHVNGRRFEAGDWRGAADAR